MTVRYDRLSLRAPDFRFGGQGFALVIVRMMVFYHGECGLRDPRIVSLQAAVRREQSANPNMDTDRFLFPRDCFGRMEGIRSCRGATALGSHTQ